MMKTQHFLFQGDTSIIDSSDFKGVSRVVSFFRFTHTQIIEFYIKKNTRYVSE